MKRNVAKTAAIAAVALAFPFAGTAASAQTTTPQAAPAAGAAAGIADTTSSAAGKVTTLGEASTAASFAQQAASGGVFEIESGRLAMDKAANEQVRAFGSRMVQDHTLANQRLMSLARAHGIEPQPAPTAQQQQMLTQLRGLSGSAFDRQYLSDQVTAHQETIRLFEGARTSTDPGMQPFREFAVEALPTLEQHLQQAQALAGSGMPTARQ